MLDKLINDIKDKFQNKLPGDSEDKTSPNDSSIKDLLNQNEEKQSKQNEQGGHENGPEEKIILGFKIPSDSKERNSFFIRIGVVLFVIYFIVDEFVLKKVPEAPPTAPIVAEVPVKKVRRVRPVKEDTPAADQAALDASAAIPADQAALDGSTQAPIGPAAPMLKINEQEKINVEEVVGNNTDEVMKSNEDMPQSKPEEVKVNSPTAVKGELDLGVGQNSEEVRNEVEDVPEKKIEDNLNKIISQVDDTPKPELKAYVAPPDYEITGRGLVYNCVNKYWACVDRDSYFSCEKNNRWLTQQKKITECAVQNVYATDHDCQITQKINIQELKSPIGCKR